MPVVGIINANKLNAKVKYTDITGVPTFVKSTEVQNTVDTAVDTAITDALGGNIQSFQEDVYTIKEIGVELDNLTIPQKNSALPPESDVIPGQILYDQNALYIFIGGGTGWKKVALVDVP